MATTKRETILDALIACMASIDGTGVYHNTLSSGQYTSAFKDIAQVDVANMPFICLFPGPSNYVPLTNTEYTSGESIQSLDGWLISIVAYVQKNTDAQNKHQMEELIADIVTAVQTDPHLGYPAYIQNTTLKTIMPFLDIHENIIVIQITFAVKYDFARTVL